MWCMVHVGRSLLACLWINYHRHQLSENKWYIDWHFNENLSHSACHAVACIHQHIDRPTAHSKWSFHLKLHSTHFYMNRFYIHACENEKILLYSDLCRDLCSIWIKWEKEVTQVPSCQGHTICYTRVYV